MQSEEAFQNTWIKQFQTLYPNAIISISLSGINLSGMNPTEKYKLVSTLKKSGWIKGIPDITIFLPDVVINLEFKRPDGKGVQSKEQKDIELRLKALGHTYYLIDSYKKANQVISNNTTIEYRTESLNKITKDLPKVLIKDFLFFIKGTSKKEVINTLKSVYYV